MVGSVTSDWLTTVVLNHASFHSDTTVASGAGLSNQTGPKEDTQGYKIATVCAEKKKLIKSHKITTSMCHEKRKR